MEYTVTFTAEVTMILTPEELEKVKSGDASIKKFLNVDDLHIEGDSLKIFESGK